MIKSFKDKETEKVYARLYSKRGAGKTFNGRPYEH